MEEEINFRIIEIIDACKSIHEFKQNNENNISIKELLDMEDIYR